LENLLQRCLLTLQQVCGETEQEKSTVKNRLKNGQEMLEDDLSSRPSTSRTEEIIKKMGQPI
jgi:hypothetical protein